MLRSTAVVAVAFTLTAAGAPRENGGAENPGPAAGVAGSWKVTFENRVIETCDIDAGGAATETEPLRSSKGKAEPQGRAFVIKFEDDRVERWTPINGRAVVEHWFPAAQYPDGPRVLGIAERTP
jgi:hypothetical protein